MDLHRRRQSGLRRRFGRSSSSTSATPSASSSTPSTSAQGSASSGSSTSIQAIRTRFGAAGEQVFTWLQLPFGLLQAGIWLNSLGVFFAAVFGLDLSLTIMATGLVVLVMALIGGSWAVLASDFIQVLILMPVCLAVTVLALLKVGGIGGFVARVPAAHLDLGRSSPKSFSASGVWR